MEQVTYGVVDLIDWNARIPVGKACMCVHFTGGALTKYGVTPAEFTTCDPFTRRVIEDSDYFRSGRITVLRRAGRPESGPPATGKAPCAPTKEMEVACLEDAIEYLRSNHAVPSYRVRNVALAQEIGAAYGVKFIFADAKP